MWYSGSKEGEETLTVTVDNSFNGAVSKSGGNASFETDGLVFQSSVYVRI